MLDCSTDVCWENGLVIQRVSSMFSAGVELLLRPDEKDDGYHVYATEFDVEIDADELDFYLGWRARRRWKKAIQQYETDRPTWLPQFENISDANTVRAPGDSGSEGGADLVVSLLVDHSGSLRQGGSILACGVVEVVANYLSRLGVAYEILGFTTTTWKGGLSREKWQADGKPWNPGRLCDLLHIVYKSADETYSGAPSEIMNLLCDSLLKENIDGEAICWAAERLRVRPEAKKLIVVVSDGAPVDDSTLAVNSSGFLEKHLRSVIGSISSEEGYRVGAVGLNYDVSRYYPRHVTLSSATDPRNGLIAFLNQCLVGPFSGEISPWHWTGCMSDMDRERFLSFLPSGS